MTSLSRSTLMFVICLIVGIAAMYAAFGWGLKTSKRKASYQLINYWTKADNQELKKPFAITVDPRSGNVLITDARAFRVVVFSTNGDFLRAFGKKGSKPGEFQNPTGIAVGKDGSIYVADYDLDRIQKFTANGDYLLTWGSSGKANDQFNSPNGMSVDSHGNVYVSDFYNGIVKVFNSEGKFVRTIGKPGRLRSGALNYPTDVETFGKSEILVADAYNYQIQAFDLNGTPLSHWGWHIMWLWPSSNNANRGFNVPTGVAFNQKNKFIHVADSANRRIVMLDSNGNFVADWIISKKGSGYYTPVSIAVSPDGKKVYATDIDNKRIVVLGVKTISSSN